MIHVPVVLAAVLAGTAAHAGDGAFERDTFATTAGELRVTFIGHASYMLETGETVIHIDPWSRAADYSALPKAGIVLITHEHVDHLDPKALGLVTTGETTVICPPSAAEKYERGEVMRPGDTRRFGDIHVEAVHAYNLMNIRNPGGRLVHPRGLGNGYILTIGETRVYCMGETEQVPEIGDVGNIDIAFMAMDSVYNLTPGMAAELARAISPAILYPIHFADEDPGKLAELLDGSGIDVRIRRMK